MTTFRSKKAKAGGQAPRPLKAPIRMTIPLCPVTKKNHQRILSKGNGQRFIAPSEQYTDYQDAAAWYVKHKGEKIDDRVTVRCLFYMGTKRRVDLNNLLEAATDLLTHCGVLEDDNSRIVASHDGSRVLYDKEHPRTEIYIDKLEE